MKTVQNALDQFAAISENVFDLNLFDYFDRQEKKLICVETRVESNEVVGLELVHGSLSDSEWDKLSSMPYGDFLAAFATDVHDKIGSNESRFDLLIWTKKLLSEPDEAFAALLYHEFCHFAVESEMIRFEDLSLATQSQIKGLRSHTRWIDESSDPHHSDLWLGVLLDFSGKLLVAYPELYSSKYDVIIGALKYDLAEYELSAVEWSLLDTK